MPVLFSRLHRLCALTGSVRALVFVCVCVCVCVFVVVCVDVGIDGCCSDFLTVASCAKRE